MAKPASFRLFFLCILIICCSGFLVGFSSTPGGGISLSQIPMIGKILARRALGDTTIITVPSSNPVAVNPTNPAAVPITVPSTTNSPVPVAAYPPPSPSPVSVPVINSQPPPPNSNSAAPAIPGQKWCVAKTGASQSALQSALDYACGMGGADCSQIQQGGRCYNPNTLQNHASFAFNNYYQKNPVPTSCDFGGTATLVNTNPSSGSCIYSSSSSSSTPTPSSSTTPTPPSSTTPTPPSSTTPTPSSPTTFTSSTPTTSPTPTPTTPSSSSSSSGGGAFGYGSPSSSSVLNSSSPLSGSAPAFGSQSPPTTTWSHSDCLRPFVASTLLLVSLVTAKLSMRP